MFLRIIGFGGCPLAEEDRGAWDLLAPDFAVAALVLVQLSVKGPTKQPIVFFLLLFVTIFLYMVYEYDNSKSTRGVCTKLR